MRSSPVLLLLRSGPDRPRSDACVSVRGRRGVRSSGHPSHPPDGPRTPGWAGPPPAAYPCAPCPNARRTFPAAPATPSPARTRRCSARPPASAPTWCSSTSRTPCRRSRRRRPAARSSTRSRTRTGATPSCASGSTRGTPSGRTATSSTVVENAGERLDEIMLPKVETAAAGGGARPAAHPDREGRPAAQSRVGIEAQIETAQGLINVEEICAASDRLETIIFGPADFAASMEMPVLTGGVQIPEYPGDHFHYVFMQDPDGRARQRPPGHRRPVPQDPRARRAARLRRCARASSASTASGRCTPTR